MPGRLQVGGSDNPMPHRRIKTTSRLAAKRTEHDGLRADVGSRRRERVRPLAPTPRKSSGRHYVGGFGAYSTREGLFTPVGGLDGDIKAG